MLKIALISLLSVNIYADWDEEEDNVITGSINKSKKEKEENIHKVWTSNEENFSVYYLSFTGSKFKIDKQGDIVLFLTTDRGNVDIENIFDFVKFDTTHDKNIVYKCAVTDSQAENNFCAQPYYTQDAVKGSAVIGALFGALTGGIEKKFDKAAFAKFIIKNENSLSKTITNIFMRNVSAHADVNSIKTKQKVAPVKAAKAISIKDIDDVFQSPQKEREPAVVNDVVEDSREVGVNATRQSNDTRNYKKYYCTTEWILVYNEKYPPPGNIEEFKIELAESGSDLVLKTDKTEYYTYKTDIEKKGKHGLSFKSNIGKGVNLYSNGELFVTQGAKDILKANCPPIEFDN